MSYTVYYKRSAEKELAAIPQKFREKIKAAVLDLANNPRPYGCKKMSAEYDGFYRLEVASGYRVVYTVDDGTVTVVVVEITTRQNAYKK